MKIFLSVSFLLFFVVVAEANHCHPYVSVAHAPPVIYTVPVNPGYYYSVADLDREKRMVDEIVRRLAPPVPGQSQPEQAPPAKKSFRILGGRSPSPDQEVANLFGQFNCLTCHKPGSNSPGRVMLVREDRSLFNETDIGREKERRSRIYEAIASGRMPKDGSQLTVAQKETFRVWSNSVR